MRFTFPAMLFEILSHLSFLDLPLLPHTKNNRFSILLLGFVCVLVFVIYRKIGSDLLWQFLLGILKKWLRQVNEGIRNILQWRSLPTALWQSFDLLELVVVAQCMMEVMNIEPKIGRCNVFPPSTGRFRSSKSSQYLQRSPFIHAENARKTYRQARDNIWSRKGRATWSLQSECKACR